MKVIFGHAVRQGKFRAYQHIFDDSGECRRVPLTGWTTSRAAATRSAIAKIAYFSAKAGKAEAVEHCATLGVELC